MGSWCYTGTAQGCAAPVSSLGKARDSDPTLASRMWVEGSSWYAFVGPRWAGGTAAGWRSATADEILPRNAGRWGTSGAGSDIRSCVHRKTQISRTLFRLCIYDHISAVIPFFTEQITWLPYCPNNFQEPWIETNVPKPYEVRQDCIGPSAQYIRKK